MNIWGIRADKWKGKNQMKILELKNIISEMKNSLDELKSRLDTGKEGNQWT